MLSRMWSQNLYFGSLSFIKKLSILNSICFQALQTQAVVNIAVESFSESAADVASGVARVVMVEVSVEICFMLLIVFNKLFQILMNHC